ncbi:MAG: hypothetical protein ACFE7S_04840 [Candidatus Hodarchaeota archaeon]
MSEMTAKKSIFSLLKAFSLIFATAFAGLGFVLSYDSATLASSLSGQQINVTHTVNATHATVSTSWTVSHGGFLYVYDMNITMELYADTVAGSSVDNSTILFILGPGTSRVINIQFEIPIALWSSASSWIVYGITKGSALIAEISFVAFSLTSNHTIAV